MTVLAGAPILASDINKLGRVDEVIGSADSAATSGTTELTIESLTCAVVSGRTYRITWVVTWQGSVAADRFLMRLRAAGSQITYDTAVIASTGAVEQDTVATDWTSGTTGNVTFTGTFQRNAGTGTLTAKGAGSQMRILSVDYVSG